MASLLVPPVDSHFLSDVAQKVKESLPLLNLARLGASVLGVTLSSCGAIRVMQVKVDLSLTFSHSNFLTFYFKLRLKIQRDKIFKMCDKSSSIVSFL